MGFLEDFEQTLATQCHQNEPPFCQAACPFRLDIRGMEEKWKKGRFNAAYRTYQNTVGFPLIVSELCPHPCEGACIRQRVDRGVAISLLEKATVDYAKRKTPNAYNLPSKGRKIAIVGGGLSGLGCALRLCNKKYEVTLFERSDVLGGHARSQMDAAVFDGELENQFQFETWEKRMGEEITSLDSLKEEYDAIYVATGAGGERFGLELDSGGAFATKTPGVFMGGALVGGNDMEALADGLDVSLAIERYLKTGGMNEPFHKKGTLLTMDSAGIQPEEGIVPANGDRFTAEEAQAEIGRCRKCACDACMKACPLMRIHEKTPRRIYEEIYITIRPGTLSRDGTWATRLITTCDQCGLCKAVCPQKIDIGEFFHQAMAAMRAKGAMPWVFHDFWLRDMDFSTKDAGLCRRPMGVEKSRYAFFPGCQLGASDARYVTETYRWLTEKEPDTAIWMSCCGAPVLWAGEEALHGEQIETLRREWQELGSPTVIFACPSCRKMFEKYLPEIPGVFLEQVMEEWGLPERSGKLPVDVPTFTLFDPCAARDYPELRDSVRRLAAAMRLSWEDLPSEGEKARCCGYGGHINIAAPNYTRKVVREQMEGQELPYLTYCVNCRESFAGQGKETIHLLDLLFGLNGTERPAGTVTERRNERLAAKRELLKTCWNETMEEEEGMNLLVEKELERKLSAEQILVSDMEQVVAHCEAENCGVLDPDNGHIIGHLKIMNMTYWAEYEVLKDGGFRLHNGYAHRMNLEGE